MNKLSEEYYREMIGESHKNFVRVLLTDEEMRKTHELAEKIANAKKWEQHHKVDGDKEVKRFWTGLKGEMAVEKLLGMNIIEWEAGNSNTYNHSDIKELNVGIKTVEKYKFPIVFKKNYYPQIICVVDDERPNLVFVCGLASKENLNTYQDDDLILDPKLRARGTKTGWYGFQNLKPMKELMSEIK